MSGWVKTISTVFLGVYGTEELEYARAGHLVVSYLLHKDWECELIEPGRIRFKCKERLKDGDIVYVTFTAPHQ